jgi:broad specificity phosphatase PhoE
MLPHRAFHFVRHGETEWNRLGRFQGRTDIPLNQRGEAQAAALRPHLNSFGFRSIAASPLVRARPTAEILNADLGLPIHFSDALMEFDVGPFAGKGDTGDWLCDWRRGNAVAGVESLTDFATRVGRGIKDALALEGPVLVVAHGGLIWALEHLLGLPAALDIPNTALVHFQPPAGAEERWRIDLLVNPA